MTLAKDIMTQDVLTVKPSTSYLEAIDLLLENRISGLPVVDDDMNLVGIVTEKDFLHLLVKQGLKEKQTIEHVMSKEVKSFDEETNVVDIYSYFLDHPIRRVPIAKDGKLVGVISRRDILRLILVAALSEGA